MQAEPRLLLWGVGTSRTMRAHWALHELSLTYDLRPILPRSGETKTAEFTRINPRQKIPALQDGDFTIAESPAIVAYLAETYGRDESPLIPTDRRERARWLEWCFHIISELDATSLYVMRRHGDLKHIYGEAPVAFASSGEYFVTQLRHAEQALRDKRSYLVGEQFTTADILLTTCLTWAVDYKVPVTDSCLAYMAQMTARPAYRTSLAANHPGKT
jgi:glutathione S-transferase